MLRLFTALLCCAAGCAGTSGAQLESRAKVAATAGDAVAAYHAYADAVCAEPSDIDLARDFVQAWVELGKPGDARAKLAACELHAGVAAYLRGMAAAAGGEAGPAITALEEAESLVRAEQRAEVAYRLGLVELSRGTSAAAFQPLERAAGLAPERVDIRLALARAYAARGDHERAVQTLRGMLRLRPTANELARARAIFVATVADSQDALDAESQAVVDETLAAVERNDLSPTVLSGIFRLSAADKHPRVLTAAGVMALKRGMMSEAAELLRDAAARSPLDPNPLQALGVALYAADRFSEALGPLYQAWLRNPFDVSLGMLVASAARAQKRNEIAREAYAVLVVLEPARVEHHLWLARLERSLGDLAAAQRAAAAGYAVGERSIPLLLERATIEAQITHTAVGEAERSASAERTLEMVDQLLEAAPEHPAAAALIQLVEDSE